MSAPVEENARAAGGGAAGSIIGAIIEIGKAIASGVQHDKDARSKFTKEFVEKTREQYPDQNVVICHTKHHYQWEGTRGEDWAHQHQEFDIQIGGTIGYEIYIAKGGEFWREGDGGYLNWAYAGAVTKTDDNGKHLVFVAP